jgi:hypothetical protein
MITIKYFLKKLLGFTIIFFSLISFSVNASDLTSTNFIIKDPIIGTGGGYGTSTNFQLISSGNTLLSGYATSASFINKYGFLYYEDEVAETISFDIDTTAADTCGVTESGGAYAVPLGIITTTNSKVSGATDGVNNICVDLDSNAPGGVIVIVRNANGPNGLSSTSVPSDNINSADGSIANGSENYGLCVVSTSSTTGTLDDEGGYNADTCAANSETNNVQALSTAGENIFDTNGAAVTGGRGQISVNASISTTTPAHNDYADTLTFIATGTF